MHSNHSRPHCTLLTPRGHSTSTWPTPACMFTIFEYARVVCVCASAVVASSLSHLGRWCVHWTSQRCPWPGCLHWQWPWCRHPCSKNRVTLLRCPTAASPLTSIFTNDCLFFRSLVVSFLGWTTVASYLSVFLPIFNDASRPFSTLQLVLYFDLVDTITSPMSSRYYTGYTSPGTGEFQTCADGISYSAWHGPGVLFESSYSFRYQTCMVITVSGRHLYTRAVYSIISSDNIGRRSFPVAAATFWNTLPVHVQSLPSIATFGQWLKTFLYQQAFPDVIIWHY